jgi:hypothetical protein
MKNKIQKLLQEIREKREELFEEYESLKKEY